MRLTKSLEQRMRLTIEQINQRVKDLWPMRWDVREYTPYRMTLESELLRLELRLSREQFKLLHQWWAFYNNNRLKDSVGGMFQNMGEMCREKENKALVKWWRDYFDQ